MVFAPFCSENRYRLYPFWSGVGFVFGGTTECMEVFIVSINSKWVKRKEKYANSTWIKKSFFFYCSNLSNDDVISSRPGLKTSAKNDFLFIWNTVRISRENRVASPHQEFPGVPAPTRVMIASMQWFGSRSKIHGKRWAGKKSLLLLFSTSPLELHMARAVGLGTCCLQ